MATNRREDQSFYAELRSELQALRADNGSDRTQRLEDEIDAARLLLRDAMPWMDEDSSLVQLAQAASVFLTRRHELREQIDAALDEHACGD